MGICHTLCSVYLLVGAMSVVCGVLWSERFAPLPPAFNASDRVWNTLYHDLAQASSSGGAEQHRGPMDLRLAHMQYERNMVWSASIPHHYLRGCHSLAWTFRMLRQGWRFLSQWLGTPFIDNILGERGLGDGHSRWRVS